MDFKNKRILILGAGVSGAFLAWTLKRLGAHVRVVEREVEPGGIGRSYKLEGATYEFGPHILHAKKDTTIRFYKSYGVRPIDYYTKMSYDDSLNHLVDFPFSLDTVFQLPQDVARKVVAELYELGRKTIDHTNLETYLQSVNGETLYSIFNKGYSRKFWGRDAVDIPANGAAGWISFRTEDKRLFSEWQGYPKGGYSAFFAWLLDGIERTQARVRGLHVEGRKVVSVDTDAGPQKADVIFSTIAPHYVFPDMEEELEYVGKAVIAVKMDRGPLLPEGIGGVYFPNKWRFNRVCEYPAMGDPSYPHLPAGTLLGFEYNVFPWHGPFKGPDELIEDTRAACRELFDAKITAIAPHFHPAIYPMRNESEMAKYEAVAARANELDNLYMTGRLGAFRYVNMNDCIEMALDVLSGITGLSDDEILTEAGV